jgi:endonuclease/exonuclease/phosphatase family metal-dependent hydrolase
MLLMDILFRLLLIIIALYCRIFCFSENKIRVMFYNVENYFDCEDDSLKIDDEFLPGGIRGWTPSKFWKKTGNIARVLAVVGDNGFPDIVGMAEVENDRCLQKLTRVSPLKNAGYSFIHYESQDIRGIDVCLLYNPYVFAVLKSRPVSVIYTDEPEKKTRDILYVVGKVYSADTLHVFVCHFPSRLGGELETGSKRQQVAAIVRHLTDSIFNVVPKANILIMGDFNDTPDCPSIRNVLEAVSPEKYLRSTKDVGIILYDLMEPFVGQYEFGTHKNQSEWAILDQIIVSGNLMEKSGKATIFRPDFLLVPDRRWLGEKPFRTYYGMKYQGGYSDHLPVYMDIKF